MKEFSNYKKTKENAREFYNNIHSVFSPALRAKVRFSAEGFNHIIFKNSNSEREKSSQILRFKLLSLAKKFLIYLLLIKNLRK